MQAVKLSFAAAVFGVVAYTVWLTTDTIVWFVGEAAALALLSVRVCGGLLIVVVVTGAAWLLLRQAHERNRQRDGAFALREYWLEPWPRRLLNSLAGRPSARVVYDPNANMSHAAVVHNAVYVAEPAAGWNLQLAYMADIERTRRTQAAVPGDGVLSLPWGGGGGGMLGGIANAATGRMLAGAYDKPIRPVTVDASPQLPEPEPDPVAPITPADVVAQSSPTQIVMGQTADGSLVRWDLTRTPHLRYHGMTRGAGKTNAIQTVAAAALTTGAHVVVFDRVQFKDWQDFAPCAELVDTSDPTTLADGAARLLTIYHNRTRQLAQAGARDVAQMVRPPRRIIAVIPEFGAQCETARLGGSLPDIEYALTQLLRLAAATGIHVVLEDQVTEHWPRGMSANAMPVIGKLPTYAGQACGFVGRGGLTTETFAPYQFWHDGRLFQPPHMQPALRGLLASVPAPRTLVMLTPPWKGVEGSSQQVHSEPNEAVHGQFTAVHTRVDPPPAAPVNYTPTTVEGWYEWTIDNYLPAHPELLQTDDRGRGMGVKALAETMAAENGKDLDAMKGTASEVAKRIREAAHLPSGARLGTDITGGAQ